MNNWKDLIRKGRPVPKDELPKRMLYGLLSYIDGRASVGKDHSNEEKIEFIRERLQEAIKMLED
tara:strand:- start:746 stop:937 length:192 start_codon:yes stop_codon:yes gene_type:complete